MGNVNQCADELKLTGFIADHSEMCQTRDHKKEKYVRECVNQCVDELKLTRFRGDHSRICQNRDHVEDKITVSKQ